MQSEIQKVIHMEMGNSIWATLFNSLDGTFANHI